MWQEEWRSVWKKEYNMTINRLPAKTWNWLRMNETQLEKIEVPTAGGVKVSLPEKITTAENEGSQPWNADFAGIPSGVGEDMDGLLTAAGVKAQHYEVSEETTEAQPLLLDYTYVQNSLQAGAVAVRARKNSEITVIQDFASDRGGSRAGGSIHQTASGRGSEDPPDPDSETGQWIYLYE